MTLIIKDKVSQMKKGYPTISDKYQVKGGILEGDNALAYGQLVQYGSTTGYYKAVDGDQTISAATDIAGVRLAVNVKLINRYPGNGEVLTEVGEAFDLCFAGYIALQVEFDYTTDTPGDTTNRDAAFADLSEGKTVYANTDGTITTDSTSGIEIGIFQGQYDVISEEDNSGTTTAVVLANVKLTIE